MENNRIKYELPEAGDVTIKVVDIIGNPVRFILNNNAEAGSYEFCLQDEKFSPGKYYYKIVYTRLNGYDSEERKKEHTITAGQFKIEN